MKCILLKKKTAVFRFGVSLVVRCSGVCDALVLDVDYCLVLISFARLFLWIVKPFSFVSIKQLHCVWVAYLVELWEDRYHTRFLTC